MKPHSKSTLEELTDAIRRSDETAFEAFYHRYYESLFRFLWIRVQSRELTRELVQETFIRLWENRHRLDSRKSIKAYVYRIGYNLLLNHLKGQKVHRAYIDNRRENIQAQDIELQTRIQIALQRLPEKIRIVFILNQVEGFKYAEIAETCSVSVKTVERRMARAVQLLRREL